MSDDTVTVELASGIFVHGGEFKHGGDTFDVAAATADEHAELERVSDDESGGSAAEDATEPPFDPGEHTVDELESRMADSDHSDAEREALANAEARGEDRTSAIEVLAP